MILAIIIYGWELSIREWTTEDTMSMTDHFVLMLKGGFCNLYLKIKT